ncbi:glutathione peroxidase [Martelella lutilitoris]|uniref:Glutathione peroxidase n=1 Tax=Martelella lutilitoris TaxID=2583532 RepID=A0A7T7HLD0_9HYPH|nr:glutathione peroxidase [Martelella lutilitoris]QQM31318.1 glutathione peroxidase [Martelella lutilitoris]
MTIYDFSAKSIDGKTVDLSDYKGHVLLIVNTASQCGFTPQYEGLEDLYRKYREQAFSVLGFPCNQFGGQEPGDEDEIDYFCKMQYDIDFPMFAKVDVNGDDAHPLFKYLKKERPGFLGSGIIKWNFTKFLIDRDGVPIRRFAPTVKPEDIQDDLNDALAVGVE